MREQRNHNISDDHRAPSKLKNRI